MALPDKPIALEPDQVAELNKKLSTMRHNVNNYLALIVAVNYGFTQGVSANRSQRLRAIGAILRTKMVDSSSPIAYGYSDTLAMYQAADVLVHPSFSDTFGRVVIEGLACGLPVVTTRLAGASELIADGTQGFVLDDPQQTDLLAKRMACFADENLRQKFSAAARTLAEQFPKSGYVEQTAAAIEAEGRRKNA